MRKLVAATGTYENKQRAFIEFFKNLSRCRSWICFSCFDQGVSFWPYAVTVTAWGRKTIRKMNGLTLIGGGGRKWRTKNQIAGHENAGHENARHDRYLYCGKFDVIFTVNCSLAAALSTRIDSILLNFLSCNVMLTLQQWNYVMWVELSEQVTTPTILICNFNNETIKIVAATVQCIHVLWENTAIFMTSRRS